MNLIDRYVYVATERLPVNTREDVSRELRTNIEDMLPENATEEQIRAALEKLGNPVKMAAEYGQQKRYLIGPDLYDSYLSVLKLVLVIVTSVFAFIALLEGFLGPTSKSEAIEMSVGFFVNMFTAVLEGAIQGALWVTLIFVILERSGVNEGKIPFVKKRWSPDDLLKLQLPSKGKISRGETIFSMICTVFFTALLYVRPQIFGWYTNGDSGLTVATPLFDIERLQRYIPVLFIFVIVLLCIFIWKFIIMEWNLPLAITNLFYNVAVCVLVGIMMSDSSLLNQEFLTKISNLFEITLSDMTSVWLKGSLAVSYTVFVVISLWDSISALIKCKR